MLRHPGLAPLSRDHHHALALCVRCGRALQADCRPDTVASVAAEIVREFDAEIRGHFDFEEGVLFPALEVFEVIAPVVAELKGEHARLLASVDRLRADPLRAEVDEFRALLAAHIRKEERILFEQAQELMKSEALDRFAALRAG